MPTWIKQLKVLVWDLDGTLYPPEKELNQRIDREIIKALASAQGTSFEEAKSYFSKNKKELKSSTKVLDSAGIDGGAFFIDLWFKLPLVKYIKPNLELQRLLTNRNSLIHILHTNSNTLDTVKLKLDCLGVEVDNFFSILTFPKNGFQKPDKEAFEMLLDETKIEAKEILYLGDRVEVDLIPAKEIGMYTALINYGQRSSDSFNPDLEFETPMKALQQIYSRA